MTLRGGRGRDANFNMNFEPSFLIVGYMYICDCLQVQVWLSATFAMTLRGRGGGPRPNVIMTLIFYKIVWKCPLRDTLATGAGWKER